MASVRVQCKIDELQRIAAEDRKDSRRKSYQRNFDQETPTRHGADGSADTGPTLKKRIKEIETAAGQELKALGPKRLREAAQSQEQVDPEQAQMMLQTGTAGNIQQIRANAARGAGACSN